MATSISLSAAVITRELLRLLAAEGYRGVWLEPGETWGQHFVEIIYDYQVRSLSLDEFSHNVLSNVVSMIHNDTGGKIGLLFVSDFLPLPGNCWQATNEKYEGIAMRCVIDYRISSDQFYVRWDFRTLK